MEGEEEMEGGRRKWRERGGGEDGGREGEEEIEGLTVHGHLVNLCAVVLLNVT